MGEFCYYVQEGASGRVSLRGQAWYSATSFVDVANARLWEVR